MLLEGEYTTLSMIVCDSVTTQAHKGSVIMMQCNAQEMIVNKLRHTQVQRYVSRLAPPSTIEAVCWLQSSQQTDLVQHTSCALVLHAPACTLQET